MRAYLYLSITALAWGGNAVAGKMAVGHISPFLLTSLRWLFALLIVLPFAIGTLKKDWPLVRANWKLLTALGALGFTVFNGTLYLALNYTSTINVVIEQAGMPLVIFLANFVLLRIAVSPLQIVGFLLTLVGVAVTVSNGDLATLLRLELNQGDALMLLAVLLYGGYTVALRWKPAIHWLSLMTVLSAAALVASIPLTIAEAGLGAMVLPDATGWALVAYTALFPSLIAQILYIRGIELIGGNRAGLFINLVPIFGTILAVVILSEPLYAFHLVGLGLVLGGIALAERGKPKQKAPDAQPAGRSM
jgi:drug/metabolite transporter (DMT)-like permease